MKLLITLISLLTIAVSAQAETSQILRQNINPAHLDPGSFRGGVIEMNDEQIKLALFLQPSDSDQMKEMVISANIYGSSTNGCNEVTYLAKTLKDSIISVTDRSNQTCDDVVLFPVVAEYVTFDDGDELISKFEGSSFISLSKPTGTLKLGTTLNTNYGTPTIMNVIRAHKSGKTEPKDTDGNGYPVVLPILYDK